MDSDLVYVRDQVAERMDEILTFFKKPAKITIIVRRPGLPDQDLCMTDDEPQEIIDLMLRRKKEAATT